LLSAPGFAQVPGSSATGYVEHVFRLQFGELPQMGWFTGDGFVAKSGADEVVLYGPAGSPSTGRRKGSINADELKLMRMRQLACEPENAGTLAIFDVEHESQYDRSLYITKKPGVETRSGLTTIRLDSTALAAVNRLLQWPSKDSLRRDEAIGLQAGLPYYSLHRLYNVTTGLLREEAIVLHAGNGQILGHKLLRGLDVDQPCDGCSIPNYGDGGGIYIPLNIFEIAGFRFPLLLLNTSTVEGRALSLVTFTPDAQLDTLSVYEYVAHCE
jgi:hypothetical protein